MRATVLHSSATPNTTDLPPAFPFDSLVAERPFRVTEAKAVRRGWGRGGAWGSRGASPLGLEKGGSKEGLTSGNGPAHQAEPFVTPSPAAFKRGAALFPQVFEKTARSGGRERCWKLPAQCFPLMPAPVSLARLGQARQVTRGLDEDQRDLEHPGPL